MRAVFDQLKHTNILCGTAEHFGRSHGIDALRGIFAIWVLMTHIIAWTDGSVWMPIDLTFRGLGWIFQSEGEIHPAVLGFIVLSGYCIHRKGLRTDRLEIVPFAARRCFRILPVYVVASVVGIVAFYADDKSPVFSMATEVRAECLAAKFFFYSTPAFHPCSVVGNAPLATVTVEIVLYVLYGLFFWLFVWRNSEDWIWILCGLSWIATLISAGFASRYPAEYNWWQNASIYGFLPYWWLGAAFINPAIAAAMRRFLLPLLLSWATLTAAVVLVEPNAFVGEIRKLIFACCIGLAVSWLDTLNIRRNNPASSILNHRAGVHALGQDDRGSCQVRPINLSHYRDPSTTRQCCSATYDPKPCATQTHREHDFKLARQQLKGIVSRSLAMITTRCEPKNAAASPAC
jgi:peptidoglycan/LPS O-acetylase OafA/YrhL